MLREYTVIITQVCFSYNFDINKEHTRYCYNYEIVLLYYFLCCNVCTETHGLESILYRQSDGYGSPWTMHAHKCVA